MDVPPDLLRPPETYGRGFCPHDAALVLDGWLPRLAAQEAQCRILLGALAHRFLARRGHHQLGFGRVGDYSRERLRNSARQLQRLATVSARPDRRGPRPCVAVSDGPPRGEATPGALARLDADVDTLDAFALDARMRAVLRAMRRIDWQLGRLLRLFLDRRLYRLMRFPSAARYLTERRRPSAREAGPPRALHRETHEEQALGAP